MSGSARRASPSVLILILMLGAPWFGSATGGEIQTADYVALWLGQENHIGRAVDVHDLRLLEERCGPGTMERETCRAVGVPPPSWLATPTGPEVEALPKGGIYLGGATIAFLSGGFTHALGIPADDHFETPFFEMCVVNDRYADCEDADADPLGASSCGAIVLQTDGELIEFVASRVPAVAHVDVDVGEICLASQGTITMIGF